MDRTFLRGLAQLAVFLLFAAGIPAMFAYKPKHAVASSRDAISISEELKRLEREAPDIIVIGDSMVPCRVDKEILSRELGKKVSLLNFDGSASASWFLLFKNIVCKMEKPPELTVFFFRDIYFHKPRHRTTGQRLALLKSVSVGAEPELEAVLTGDAKAGNPILNAAEDLLDSAWSIDGYRDSAAEYVREKSLMLTRITSKSGQRRAYMDEVFALKNLRPDLANDIAELGDGKEHDGEEFPVWSDNPVLTILPAIRDQAKQHNINVMFYRVKQRKHTTGENDTAKLTAYLDGFKSWTTANGFFYADESIDPEILEKHFSDGDHTAEEFTPFLSTRVGAAMKAAMQPGSSKGPKPSTPAPSR